MTTVGYGDITPNNSHEVVISIIYTFFSCMMFGFILNSIGNIISGLRKKVEDQEALILQINKYMKQKVTETPAEMGGIVLISLPPYPLIQ